MEKIGSLQVYKERYLPRERNEIKWKWGKLNLTMKIWNWNTDQEDAKSQLTHIAWNQSSCKPYSVFREKPGMEEVLKLKIVGCVHSEQLLIKLTDFLLSRE